MIFLFSCLMILGMGVTKHAQERVAALRISPNNYEFDGPLAALSYTS